MHTVVLASLADAALDAIRIVCQARHITLDAHNTVYDFVSHQVNAAKGRKVPQLVLERLKEQGYALVSQRVSCIE